MDDRTIAWLRVLQYYPYTEVSGFKAIYRFSDFLEPNMMMGLKLFKFLLSSIHDEFMLLPEDPRKPDQLRLQNFLLQIKIIGALYYEVEHQLNWKDTASVKGFFKAFAFRIIERVYPLYEDMWETPN